VEPVKRMKIIGSAASVRRVGTGHRTEMIDKYRSIPFPKAQRFVADRFESEAGRRGRRGLRFRILRRRGGNGSQQRDSPTQSHGNGFRSQHVCPVSIQVIEQEATEKTEMALKSMQFLDAPDPDKRTGLKALGRGPPGRPSRRSSRL